MLEIAAAGPLPVPLAELKAFLRIGNNDEDALLAGLVRTAGTACEAFTKRMVIARPVDEVLAASRSWTRLTAAPVSTIETVAALADDGTAGLLAPDMFAIDIDAAGEGWVRLLQPISARRVRVHCQAGMASDANGVPETIRHGIIRLAAHLYAHREDPAGSNPPAAVTALWRPWRRLNLG